MFEEEGIGCEEEDDERGESKRRRRADAEPPTTAADDDRSIRGAPRAAPRLPRSVERAFDAALCSGAMARTAPIHTERARRATARPPASSLPLSQQRDDSPTLTKRRLYFMRLHARPVGFFFFSCGGTLGVWPRTLPARASEPWTLPVGLGVFGGGGGCWQREGGGGAGGESIARDSVARGAPQPKHGRYRQSLGDRRAKAAP